MRILINECLKMPEGTVKSRLRKTRMQLKDMLKEGIEDILFEECEVVGGEAGCISGFVHDTFEDHNVLLELQLLYDEQIIPDGEEVIVRLKNLVQTKKTDIAEYLVEGEWELRLKLPPMEADTVRFYPESDVILGEHELYIAQTGCLGT